MTTRPRAKIFPWPRHKGPDFCVALANSTLPPVEPEGKRRIAPQTPRMASYADVVALARTNGVLSPTEAATLRRMAAETPDLAASVFKRCLEMRTFLARLLTAMVAGRRPSDDDVDAIDAYLVEVPTRLRLIPGKRRAACHLEGDSHLDRIVWVIAACAAEIVLVDGHRRVRQCEAKNCRRLFYDRSNGQQRKWCDRKTCGDIEKSRRYNRYRLSIRHTPLSELGSGSVREREEELPGPEPRRRRDGPEQPD